MNAMTKMAPNTDLEQIAALADGALDDQQAAIALDKLLGSSQLRAYWDELHVTGDLLRSDNLAPRPASSQFMAQFASRLALEPTILLPRSGLQSRLRGGWIRYGLPGVSVAAAAAMVAWIAMPQSHPLGPAGAPVASNVAASAPQTAQAVSAPSAPVRPVDPLQLNEYLAAHQQFAATAIRGPGFIQAASLHSVRAEDSTGTR